MASSLIRLRWPEPAAFESAEALEKALADRSRRLDRLLEERAPSPGPATGGAAGYEPPGGGFLRDLAGSDGGLPGSLGGPGKVGGLGEAAPGRRRAARASKPKRARGPTRSYATVAGEASKRLRGEAKTVAEVARENRDLVASVGSDVGFAVPPPEVILAASDGGDAGAVDPIRSLGLDPGGDRSRTGAGVRVAVIDSGLDTGHPEFDGASILERDSYDYWRLHEVRKGVVTSIAVPAGGPYATRHYHGTAVAGLVSGVRSGVAPGASLIIHNVFYLSAGEAKRLGWRDDQGRWQEPDTTILRVEPALMYSLAAQADILVLSFGTPGYNPCFEDEAEYLVRNFGRLVVAAAGNAGLGKNMSPGDYDGVLSVGATTADGAVWPGTSTARLERGGKHYVKPDLYAPGVNLRVPVPASVAASGYLCASGTSFAAPLVAGVAAAVLGRLRERGGERPEATAIREILLETADEIEAPAELGGRGRRLNARRAMEAAG